MKRAFLMGVLVACFMAGAMVAKGLAAGTADEARALVEKAIVYVNANGKDKAIEAFNNPQGEFVMGDLYIFMFDYSGVVLAHGANPKLIGKNMSELKDANGKLFVQEFVDKVKSGGGWVDYQWTNPETKKVQPKSSYVKGIEGTDCYVGCGIYK